ncbi:sensor histidine kinase [Lactiplantibacillus modestisalitolerans]|uniref:Sensor histidine kinase n=1 Tax=Lactiplantibacillus modestisalitolerans TaxID=1457219 RepID=A0ABV5WQZ3_9LACO|nr:GHKL domain-containing protein [Lactiplantibacillus modestisalitolerans]
MALLIFCLLGLAGTYEILILMLACREFITVRIALTWLGLGIGLAWLWVAATRWSFSGLILWTNLLPTLVSTAMLTRLLLTRWPLTLPIVASLVTFKRLLISGTLALGSWLLPQAGWIGAALISSAINLLVVGLLGWLGHRIVINHGIIDHFQRVPVEQQDALVVALGYGSYVGINLLRPDFASTQGGLGALFVTLIATLVFGGLSAYLITNKNNRLTDAQLLQQVSQYNELLSERNQQLHLFKHDYQNILLSLSRYIQTDDLVGLKSYFEQEVLPNATSLSAEHAPEQLRRLHAPALSGLIYAKYALAASQDVHLQVMLLEDVILPPTDQVNVVRIIGNLLDNAIDAAQQADGQVQLTVSNTPTAVQFTVQNQLPNQQVVNLKQLSKPRFTTKPGHRGYGLSSIAQLASNQLVVNYQITKNQFIAHLSLQRQ